MTTSRSNKQQGWLLLIAGIIAIAVAVLVDAASDDYSAIVWMPGIIGVVCISFGVAHLCRSNR